MERFPLHVPARMFVWGFDTRMIVRGHVVAHLDGGKVRFRAVSAVGNDGKDYLPQMWGHTWAVKETAVAHDPETKELAA
jgi:hypothetical protein